MTPAQRDQTILASIGVNDDRQFGAVMPPVHMTSNFSYERLGAPRRHEYSRSGNPTRDLLARALSDLERGQGAIITSSGMAALDLVLNLLDPGDLVVAQHDCYGGTWRLLTRLAQKRLFDVTFVDVSDQDSLAAALARSPSLVLLETPSNPLLRLTDLDAVCRQAKAAGALIAVDNTFLTPLRQKPLTLGADLVIHSTTKGINGHGDIVGGAVVAADEALADQLSWWASARGVTGAPFDAFLTLRGLRTLDVRLGRQEMSALAVARRLEASPAVSAVHYPGLESHRQIRLAREQQSGFGGVLSFELGGEAPVAEVVARLRHFTMAASVGGVESLIAHPATMSHAPLSADARAAAGIGDTLLRLSIGLEHVDDLIDDLIAAIERPDRPASDRSPTARATGHVSALGGA